MKLLPHLQPSSTLPSGSDGENNNQIIIINRTKSKTKKEKKKKNKKKRKRDDNNDNDDNDDEINNEMYAGVETHKKKKKKRTKNRCRSSDATAAAAAAATHAAHGATTDSTATTCTGSDCEQRANKKKKSKERKKKRKEPKKSKNDDNDSINSNKSSSSNKISKTKKKQKKRKNDKENVDKKDKDIIDVSSSTRFISNNLSNQTNTKCSSDRETTDRGDNTSSLSRHISSTKKDDGGVFSSSSSANDVVGRPSIAPHATARRLKDLSRNRRKRKNGTAIIVPGTSSGMMKFNNNTSSNNSKRQKVSYGTGTSFSDTRNYYGTTNNEQAVLNFTNNDASNEPRGRVRTISVRNRTANILPEGGLVACHRRRPKQNVQATEIIPEYKAVVEQQRALIEKKALTNTTIDDDIAVEDAPKNKTRTLDSTFTEWQKQAWENTFQLLIEYKKANDGSTVVPQEYNENAELGHWVHKQRRSYITKELSKYRIDRLNTIGFVWQINIFVPWIEMYERLVSYRQQFGTTAVPQIYNEDPALGSWVNTQRKNCKKKDRIQLLQDINFVWCAIGGRKSSRNR